MKRSFIFYKEHRRGIILLVFIILTIEVVIYFFQKPFEDTPKDMSDKLVAFELKLDSLEKNYKKKKDTIYPFSPNHITDYKGYVLGLNSEQIDKIKSYNKSGKYIKSITEFGTVAGIDDSLLKKIEPYLKFPQFKNKKSFYFENNTDKKLKVNSNLKKDLNQATEYDLSSVKGIGEVLSKRIVKYRNRLKGFRVNEQLLEVYGIEKEVYNRILEKFEIQSIPVIEKKNINEISLSELAKNPYVKYKEALDIIELRSRIGKITTTDDLKKIEGLTDEKINRILLYLSLEYKE